MPFNKEIEDFAQAFSTGYGMAKSKEEREAEQLDLQHKRFLTERDPITAAQADESHAIEMQKARGEITDAEAARAQKALLDPIAVQQAQESLSGTKTTNEFNRLKLGNLPTELEQGNKLTGLQIEGAGQDVEAKKRAALREPIDNAHKDALFTLEQQHAQNVITNDEYIARRNVINDKHTDAINALDETIKTHDAAPETLERKDAAAQALIDESVAGTDEKKVDIDIKKLELKKAKAKDTLLDNLTNRFKHRSKPAVNQPHAVDIGPPGGLSIDAEPGVLGPAVPVPAGSPAGSESNLGMFNPPGLEGPTEAAPAEVTTDSNAPAPVPPPAPMQAVDDTGVVSPPGQEVAAAPSDDRQQAIDYFRNGSGNTLPNGKHVLDVAGKEAVKDGLSGMAEQHGLNGDSAAVDTPETDEQARGFLTGKSAASPSTVAMMEQTVQEQSGEEEMSQNELTYSTLATGWLWNNALGEPEEAKKYAQALMSHYQMVFGQYVAMAHASAEAGNHEHTATALERAYANVPTNDELTIRPTKDGKHFIAKITDANGKVTEQQLMTPEEMGAYALDIDPSAFVPLISQAAGRESKTLSPAAAKLIAKQLNISEEEAAGLTTEEVTRIQTGEERGKSSFADRDAASKAIGDAIDTFKEEHSEQAKKLHFDDPKQSPLEDIRPITKRIILDNEIDSERALRAVINLIANGPDSAPEDLPDGKLKIHMKGFDPFDISTGDYLVLTANRRKYGVPTPSGLPADQERYRVGTPNKAGSVRPSVPAVPVAALPGSGASTRFSRVPVSPPSYGPPPRPGTNPPQSGARTRF